MKYLSGWTILFRRVARKNFRGGPVGRQLIYLIDCMCHENSDLGTFWTQKISLPIIKIRGIKFIHRYLHEFIIKIWKSKFQSMFLNGIAWETQKIILFYRDEVPKICRLYLNSLIIFQEI